MTRVIVCGLGRTGYTIFSLLRQQGVPVIGLSTTPVQFPLDDPRQVLVGNLRSADLLMAAGVREAQTLVLVTNDDALNLAILTQARVLNPKIRIVNRLFNANLGDRLDQTLPDHVSMSVASLSAPIFTFAALGSRAIGHLRLTDQTWPIHEELIDDHHPWLGRSLRDLWDNHRRMLIYYLPAENNQDLVSAVLDERCLEPGDRLIIATQPQRRTSRKSVWYRLRRRLNVHRLQSIRPTLMAIAVLGLTILTATVTYVSVRLNLSIVDALYFSVGMITGAGGNEQVAEQADPVIKVFTVAMMLFGTGVIGVCYALLNDLVLGTRFQKVLNLERMPQAHHYIVCGLGGVGMQVVTELLENGQEVVVLEPDANNRFLPMVQALKVPVIRGDASLATALQEAKIDRATALLAVTSDDMANLEIALSAKACCPRLPVIVRTQDPGFAALSQQVFDFDAILSPTELAAPSFAAAALGGRVLGNGVTASTLWIAIATLITPNHPFCNHSVKAIATSADIVPLYIQTPLRSVHGWELLDTVLRDQDVLYLTLPAKNIDQLWRCSDTYCSPTQLSGRF
ncbi:MAG: potassium channel family protein [Elainellaceae cyanobacterium]